MTVEEVKKLPVAQKMQIMEAIWEDLRDRFEQAELPDSIKRLLDQRRARARDGSAVLLDWDSVKSGIGRA
ncbi:MAG: addiction module protein [Verrucomicrobiales bacterium]|nr:addiction module protein [Verrucomicrobiales bacterium]